jgi:hypothetical protein
LTILRRLAAPLLVAAAAAAVAAAASTQVTNRTLLDPSQFSRAFVIVLHTPQGVALITTIASGRLEATPAENGVGLTPATDGLI